MNILTKTEQPCADKLTYIKPDLVIVPLESESIVTISGCSIDLPVDPFDP